MLLIAFLQLPATASSDAAFSAKVAPFLTQHCIECHSGATPKADLALDAFTSASATDARAETWLTIRDRIASGEMPPKERARPTSAEVSAISAWIDARFAASSAHESARPALRRLNRVEYVNTIRDLVGVDVDANTELQGDDVGYGFDNIGDVLSMSDLNLEKYLSAAERIAQKAICSDDPARPKVQRAEGDKLTGKAGSPRGKLRGLASNGEIGFEATFPRDGEYVLRARTFGDQAGPDPVLASLRCAKEDKLRFEVPATAKAPQENEVRVHVEAGRRRIGIAFLNDYYKPEDPNPKNRDRNLVVEWLEVSGPIDPPQLSELQRRELDPKTRGSQRDVIARLARRAWRRPVANDEIDRLVAFAKGESNFEDGVRFALQALLVSPNFLFMVEGGVQRDPQSANEPLTDHELATRLSYALWSSMPDDELFTLADAHTLHDPSVLRAQVHRMLRDGRASAIAHNFAAQWLQTRNLDRVAPDAARFPAYDERLADAMRAECEMFFDAVLREGRAITEFIDSDFTFVNEKLARHYGIPGVRGDEMRRVPIERGARGGVLGMAAVLTVTSNPTRTSPVKRGKWILENLLAAPTPPPPPGVGVIDDGHAASEKASLRERLEEHRKNPDCAACHARLDPLGFALENFDATGAWRGTDEGHAIDAAGVLPDGRKLQGATELKKIVGEGNAFTRCLTQKLVVYALGRGLSRRDDVAIDAIVASLGRSPTLEDVLQAIVASDLFRSRGNDRSHQ